MSDKTIKGNSNVFACEMKKMVNNQLMSDVQFQVGTERKVFFGHRCILSARCEIFKSMFLDQINRKDVSSQPIILQEMKVNTFKQLLQYLYTNQINLDKGETDDAIELLAVAMEFGLDDLRKVMQTFLIYLLHKGNVCKILQNSYDLGLVQLKESCFKFINTNIQSISDFGDLSPDVMEEIVESDDLDIVSELKLVKIIREWAKSYAEKSELSVPVFCKQVSRHLRLGLLKPEEIAQLEEENKQDNIIPPECFALAWKTHALGPSGAGASVVPKERCNPKKLQPVASRTSTQSLYD